MLDAARRASTAALAFRKNSTLDLGNIEFESTVAPSVKVCLTKSSDERSQQEVMDMAEVLVSCKLQTADITVLHNVEIEDILTLARRATYMYVPPHTPIYNEGEAPKGFYFLLSGCVKSFHTGQSVCNYSPYEYKFNTLNLYRS